MKLPMRFVMSALATCTIFICANSAFAVEFKNIGTEPVIMYDAPSTRGQKLYVAPRGMPVEVVISYGAWSKVRDVAGDLSWVEAKQLTDRKNILVRILNAKIHASADASSPVLFSADKGVMLEFVDSSTPGWVKVQYSDGITGGITGYVKSGDVWGVGG